MEDKYVVIIIVLSVLLTIALFVGFFGTEPIEISDDDGNSSNISVENSDGSKSHVIIPVPSGSGDTYVMV